MTAYHRLRARLPSYLIAVVLATVPFHAFLTVWASSLFGHYTLLRLWPEIILLVLTVWVIISVTQDTSLRRAVQSSRLIQIVAAYLALTVLLGLASYWRGDVSLKALAYGLLLNMRFLVWFVVVWIMASRSSWLRVHWQRLTFIPLAIVATFALLQFFLLPVNFLAHFGYDKLTTIAPIQTINQDTETIRAQSFLRGPNPLGAYLVAGIGLAAFAVLPLGRKLALITASFLALLVTFSRSAWLGLIAGCAAALSLLDRKKLKPLIISVSVVLVLATALVFIFRHNGGIQNAILHVDTTQSSAPETSNSGHLAAVRQSVRDVVHEPIGRGPGTAGPASVYNHAALPRNSENYFLNVGQELGVIGLGLFCAILIMLGAMLRRDPSPLGRGLFVTLVALIVINLFSYAWTDPTLAYIWWGLVGVALAASAPLAVTTSRRKRP